MAIFQEKRSEPRPACHFSAGCGVGFYNLQFQPVTRDREMRRSLGGLSYTSDIETKSQMAPDTQVQ